MYFLLAQIKDFSYSLFTPSQYLNIHRRLTPTVEILSTRSPHPHDRRHGGVACQHLCHLRHHVTLDGFGSVCHGSNLLKKPITVRLVKTLYSDTLVGASRERISSTIFEIVLILNRTHPFLCSLRYRQSAQPPFAWIRRMATDTVPYTRFC